jgi:outer membrane protein OmpA-like peptidoglycan-associated protein
MKRWPKTARALQQTRQIVRVALFAAVVAVGAGAHADEHVAVSPPTSWVAGDASIVAPSPGARGDGLVRALLAIDYVRAPLTLVAEDQQTHAIVEDQLWLHAGASLAIHHRFLVGLDVPLLLHEQGEAEPFAPGVVAAPGKPALGDPELTLRGRLLGAADGFSLGVGVHATLPVASASYAGAPGPLIGPFVAAGHQSQSSFSALAAGFDWREAQTLPGVLPTRIGSSLRLALAGGVALDAARTTRLGPELALGTTVTNGARLLDPRSSVAELLLHVQHRLLGGPFEASLAFGPSVGRAPGAADFRALLGLVFSPEEPVPPPDADDDRVADESDMCPSLPGAASEDPMMHGCPALPSDADGDGVPDTLDACPRTPGEPSVLKKRHGCPKPPDRDHDGILDTDDACPEEAGVESPEAKRRGCPAPPPQVTVERAQIAISEQVQFETGTALIRDGSSALLQQVVEVLQRHREIESCEVGGHTDDTGAAEINRELSEARARAVMSWLVAHGVEARRLTARGYGSSRPLADNATDDGRARNRRVEFLITRRTAPPTQERR